MNIFQAISQISSRTGSRSRDLNAVYRAIEKGDPSIIVKRGVRKELYKGFGGLVNKFLK